MSIYPTIFQYQPVIIVLFCAHIERFSLSNESTLLLLNAPMVYLFNVVKAFSIW